MTGIPGRGACANCGNPAYIGSLMCRMCWFRLPRHIRDEVKLAVRRFWNGDIDTVALREVQHAAVEWLRQ